MLVPLLASLSCAGVSPSFILSPSLPLQQLEYFQLPTLNTASHTHTHTLAGTNGSSIEHTHAHIYTYLPHLLKCLQWFLIACAFVLLLPSNVMRLWRERFSRAGPVALISPSCLRAPPSSVLRPDKVDMGDDLLSLTIIDPAASCQIMRLALQ